MHSDQEAVLRERIAKILANGLVTQTEPFPEDDRAFGSLLAAVHDLPRLKSFGWPISCWPCRTFGPPASLNE